MEKISTYAQKLICFPIRLYQYFVRPLLPCACRFYPSCSSYALESIQVHGIGLGLCKVFGRILRCHPWADGGYDPVLKQKNFNRREL